MRGEVAVPSQPRMRARSMVRGKKNVGIAQDVVIEKVLRAGAEVGDVEDPARQRNREPKFVLLITFTPQRQKTKSLLGGLLEQRTVHRQQRRSLIERP